MFILSGRINFNSSGAASNNKHLLWDKLKSFVGKYQELIRKNSSLELNFDVIDEDMEEIDHKLTIGFCNVNKEGDIGVVGRSNSSGTLSELLLDFNARSGSLYLPQFHARMNLKDNSKEWNSDPPVHPDVYEIGDNHFKVFIRVIESLVDGEKETVDLFNNILLDTEFHKYN